MLKFIAHDSRLEGWYQPPNQNTIYRKYVITESGGIVSGPEINDFVTECRNWVIDRRRSSHNRQLKVNLEIWAHGSTRIDNATDLEMSVQIAYDLARHERGDSLARQQLVNGIYEQLREYNNEQQRSLGAGINFCRDNLTVNNVGALAPLSGMINTLTLNVCGAARYSVEHPEGHILCSQIARVLRANVLASTEIQVYSRGNQQEGTVMDFGLREGLWILYRRNGTILRMRRYPSQWLDFVVNDAHPDGHVQTRQNMTDPVGQRIPIN
jgi:hypothetical protein